LPEKKKKNYRGGGCGSQVGSAGIARLAEKGRKKEVQTKPKKKKKCASHSKLKPSRKKDERIGKEKKEGGSTK